MNRTTTWAALIAAAGIATAGGLAYANPASMPSGVAVAGPAQAKITLEQAIAAAQSHHQGGKATKAELERKRGALVYEVEVMAADNQVFDVKVDAADGKVLSSKLDRHDRDDDDDC